MTSTRFVRTLTVVAACTAAGFGLAAGPAQATDVAPLDCSGVPHAAAVAAGESAARGTEVVPMCMNGQVYAAIPLQVFNPITKPGTRTVCWEEQETVDAAARWNFRPQQEVVPMCVGNRAFGVYAV